MQKKKSDIYTHTGEWSVNGNTKKLFETPFGTVYKLHEKVLSRFNHEYFAPLYPKYQKIHLYTGDINKAIVHPLAINFCKKSSDWRKLKRYVAVDFKIRLYPAISKDDTNFLNLKFFFSNKNANSIRKYNQLNSVHFFNHSGFYFSSNYRNYRLKDEDVPNKPKVARAYAICKFTNIVPHKILHFRFIFDRKGGIKAVNTVNINGEIGFIHYSYPQNMKSIGFFAEKFMTDLLHYRKIVEVSKPIIYSTDDYKNLLTLPKIKTSYDYPYAKYIKGDFLEDKKKRNYAILRKLKNADEAYAYAMHFMKNGDIPTAHKLLKYLSLKKKHIFAMREFGICRWRGIGMKKDYKSALKYFANGTQYGDLESSSYHQFLLFKNLTMPHIDEQVASKFIRYQDYILDEDFLMLSTDFFVSYAASVRQANLMLEIGKSRLTFSPPSPFAVTANDKLEYWMTIKKHSDLYLNKKGDIPTKKDFYNQFEDSTKLFAKPNKQGDFKHIKLPANCFFRGQIMIRRWAQDRRALDKKNIKNVEEKEKEIKKINELLNKSLGVFKLGVEMNNDTDCALEILQCKVRLNKATKEDFTKEFFYKYADYPLYYLLRHAVKNPKNLAMKEFLKCNYETAITMLEEKKTTENIFLQAAIGLYIYHHLDKMHYYRRAIIAAYNPINFSRSAPKPEYYKIKSLKKAFLRLNEAVAKNHSDAMYLKALLELDRKYGLRARELFIGKNNSLLRRLVAKNHSMALYKFIELSMESTSLSIRPQWLKKLKPLRDAKHAGAWLLTGDILVRTRGVNLKTRDPLIKVYKRALEYGSIEALDRIARVYYRSGQEDILAKSTSYWKEYIKEINEQRKYDEFDLYSEQPDELKSYTIYEVFKDEDSRRKSLIGNDVEDLIRIKTNIQIGKRGLFLEAFSQRHDFTNNIVIYDIDKKPVSVKSKKGIDILRRLFEQYDLEVPHYIIEPKDQIINDRQS